MPIATDLADSTVAVVLAGGNGTRLDPLTRHVCKPALPFGGGFRSIDFTLSNCVNSGVRTIGVATQYKPAALLAHIEDAWNRTRRYAVIPWRAEEHAPTTGYRGTADAVYRNLERLDELDPRLVLVLAGDHVYKMDYRPMLAEHCARGADVTVGCIRVPVEDARHFGVLTLANGGRIERFVEKPRSRAELPHADADGVLASMGIYVFSADFLERVLTIDAGTAESRHDFGADILPKLVGNARVFGHVFRSSDASPAPYWRDIGTLQAYWQAHMDLLGPTPSATVDDSAWPICSVANTPRVVRSMAVTPRGGSIENSIVGAGSSVAGRARRCVLSNGVEIGRGADVAECVVLPGARIGAGSRLRGVIVDAGCHVPAGAVLERASGAAEPPVFATAAGRAAEYALAG
jgi:glucose-1-phosphate adenylyltransferase